jgi:hypothetical protein
MFPQATELSLNEIRAYHKWVSSISKSAAVNNSFGTIHQDINSMLCMMAQ